MCYFCGVFVWIFECNVVGMECYVLMEDIWVFMLGEDQWVWFVEVLQEFVDLCLVILLIQVFVDGYGWEVWCIMLYE